MLVDLLTQEVQSNRLAVGEHFVVRSKSCFAYLACNFIMVLAAKQNVCEKCELGVTG